MYCFSTFCYTCFSTDHLQATDTLDFDNISFLDKIVFIMPNEKVDLDIPKYICLTCCSALRISYRFQMMLLKNHKLMKGYVSQIQKTNAERKQSALKIKLVDYKKQALRNKRKLQIYNKQEHKTKETLNSQAKSTTKTKSENNDSVIYQSTEKNDENESDTYEIFIKEENSPNSKTLLGFTNDDMSCNICDSKPTTPETIIIDDSPKSRIDNKFVCAICGKVFIKINEFNYHMLFHDSASLFKCKICDKSFKQEDHLRRHVTVLHVKGGK